MRIEDQRRSEQIEDRRGISVGRGVAGGGIGIVVIVLLAMFFGVDPSVLLQGGPSPGAVAPEPRQQVEARAPSREDKMADFVAAVLGSTEDTWTELFARSGRRYEKPTLVLFTGAVESACGFAQAAVGPFYCPTDQKLYIDLAFYRDLQDRFRAPGDFAQAYVIAHEVGHHVQNLLGIAERVHAAQRRAGEREANALSVRMELQADCLAASGHNMQTARSTSSRRATSRKASARRPRSATTASRRLHAVTYHLSRSPTAARSSACGGSDAAWKRATSRPAMRSARRSCRSALRHLTSFASLKKARFELGPAQDTTVTRAEFSLK
jgi:uncharacterized protein